MSTAGSCTNGTDALAAIAAQQVGSEGSHDVAMGRGDLADQGAAGRCRDLIEPAPEHGDESAPGWSYRGSDHGDGGMGDALSV